MELKIYTDETFTEVREVRTCDRIKVPYRVGQYVVKLIPELDLTDDQKVLNQVLSSEEHITAIVRATFGLKDEDLDFIDMIELGALARQIIEYVAGKMAELGVSVPGADPNPETPATTA